MSYVKKTGSVRVISYFIAFEGAVDRRRLRKRFENNSLRITLYYLRKLGLIYSQQRKNGFIASIPWLLFLMENGVDWKDRLREKIPDISEEDLRDIERKLEEARKGVLGEFVRRLVKEVQHESIYMRLLSETRVIDAIPEVCRQGAEKYKDYEECVHYLLQYIHWLLVYTSYIISLIILHREKTGEELIDMLIIQRLTIQRKNIESLEKKLLKIMQEDASRNENEEDSYLGSQTDIRLYRRTMYYMERLLSKLFKEAEETKRSGELDIEELMKQYEEELKEHEYYERYNMATVLRSFIQATIAYALLYY